MRFYLGTPEPAWLDRVEFPLFVSRSRLARLRSHRPATCPWALDSGGFTELDRHGRWRVRADHYAQDVDLYAAEIGMPDFAAPMDRMCEPFILDRVAEVTGRRPTVREHVEATVENLLELRQLAPHLPWAPVVQGWELDDYLACAELYREQGIDLTAEPVVGVGSVCRRQGTKEAERIFVALAGLGLRLHAFGAKLDGLARYGWCLASADSQAWSYRARRIGNDQEAAGEERRPLTPRCRHRARQCSNCAEWAGEWRERVLEALERPQQTSLAV